jgi:hypothetical protein
MPTAGDSVAAGVRAHAVGCSPRYSAFPVPRVTPWATLAHCGTRRWVVERSFAWLTRFRRLARDFERLPETLAGLHYLDFACLLLAKAVKVFASSQQLLGSELRSIDERGGGFARHFGAVAGDLRRAVCSGRTFRHCPPGNGQARIPGLFLLVDSPSVQQRTHAPVVPARILVPRVVRLSSPRPATSRVYDCAPSSASRAVSKCKSSVDDPTRSGGAAGYMLRRLVCGCP